MGDEKPEGVIERHSHKLVLGGRIVGVLSVFLLVPVVRRLRAQRHERHHHRRLLFGH